MALTCDAAVKELLTVGFVVDHVKLPTNAHTQHGTLTSRDHVRDLPSGPVGLDINLPRFEGYHADVIALLCLWRRFTVNEEAQPFENDLARFGQLLSEAWQQSPFAVESCLAFERRSTSSESLGSSTAMQKAKSVVRFAPLTPSSPLRRARG